MEASAASRRTVCAAVDAQHGVQVLPAICRGGGHNVGAHHPACGAVTPAAACLQPGPSRSMCRARRRMCERQHHVPMHLAARPLLCATAIGGHAGMQWMAPSAEARQPPRWLTPEFVWHYAVRCMQCLSMATSCSASLSTHLLVILRTGHHPCAGLPLHHRPPCDSAAVACRPAVPAAGRAAGRVAAVAGGLVRPPVAVLQTRATRPLHGGAPVCRRCPAGACLPGQQLAAGPPAFWLLTALWSPGTACSRAARLVSGV